VTRARREPGSRGQAQADPGLGHQHGPVLALGSVYYLGWLGGGAPGGVLATVITLVGGALVLLALAVRSAWVKRS
jgi:hypothetical protein